MGLKGKVAPPQTFTTARSECTVWVCACVFPLPLSLERAALPSLDAEPVSCQPLPPSLSLLDLQQPFSFLFSLLPPLPLLRSPLASAEISGWTARCEVQASAVS